MTRAERARLKDLAREWISHTEEGGDSVGSVERDVKSLTALLVRVVKDAIFKG